MLGSDPEVRYEVLKQQGIDPTLPTQPAYSLVTIPTELFLFLR
jgi:hypothetical protein